ncbi:hypothetical protein HOP50_06g46130 [Chloropicon primus]|uniref:F-box domain-containing protein n=1 Tax=Chloropicon primus TaxID=1764295 RepID=A0A5B8MS16_9CHLO|nr:hypothetical protein A3770_06p45900 [Chloropicon primus]UPR01291.1 hypothetical protein HOP50_06g46130 [Chloropicon primus]|eukprot:QDZ22072.1 hypothetical protein A3770_06p45900 [Chloropicon primus]
MGGAVKGCTRGMVILHPTRARVVNEAHERAKAESTIIPRDVLQVVANSIQDARTAVNFAMCSKACKEMTETDSLWKSLYELKYPLPSKAPPKGKWKELYVFQTKFMRDVLLNKNLDEILEKAYPRWESVGSISLPVAT